MQQPDLAAVSGESGARDDPLVVSVLQRRQGGAFEDPDGLLFALEFDGCWRGVRVGELLTEEGAQAR